MAALSSSCRTGRAACGYWPIADHKIVRCDPEDGCAPVLVSGDDLQDLPVGVGHDPHRGALPLDGLGIPYSQCWSRPPDPDRTPAWGRAAGQDDEQIIAHGADPLLHGDARTPPDTDHGNDGSHPDDNAQNGEKRTHGVAPERLKAIFTMFRNIATSFPGPAGRTAIGTSTGLPPRRCDIMTSRLRLYVPAPAMTHSQRFEGKRRAIRAPTAAALGATTRCRAIAACVRRSRAPCSLYQSDNLSHDRTACRLAGAPERRAPFRISASCLQESPHMCTGRTLHRPSRDHGSAHVKAAGGTLLPDLP